MAKALSLRDSLCCSTRSRNRSCHRKIFALSATSYRHTYESQIFLGSRVTRFSGDMSCWNTGSYVPFLQGSHMQKQCQERTTLRTWGVRQRALQVYQPGYSALSWCHKHKPQGTHCKGFGIEEGPHYCFEQNVRNPLGRDQVQIALGNRPEAVMGQATINLIHKFGNPLGVPYPSCNA